MKIYRELELKDFEVISFVGGGGKTTTIFQLAEELKSLNKKVMITTTTAMFNPEEDTYDYYFRKEIDSSFQPKDSSITVFGHKIENGKLLGGPMENLEDIINRQLFNYILIESDGSKGKPIKALAGHEPVIAKLTTKTIGIIGLDSLHEKIIDIAHRPEIFIKLVDKDIEDLVEEESIVKLVLHEEGLFKKSIGDKLLLLNKADNKKLISNGQGIKSSLLGKDFDGKTIVGDVISKKFY